MLELTSVYKLIDSLSAFAFKYVLTLTSLVQILIIVGCTLLTISVSKLLSSQLIDLIKIKTEKEIKRIFNLSIQEIINLCLLLALFWIATFSFEFFEVNNYILNTASSLLTAWIIIRLISGLFKSSLWVRFIALIIWVIAALNILNLLKPTSKLLESYKTTIGEVNVSLLDLIEGLLTFSVLFWLVFLFTSFLEKRLKRSRAVAPTQRVLFVKFINFTLIIIALFIGLHIIGVNLTILAILGGTFGFGFAFGLQKVISNFISGIILLLDRSIKPGDIIGLGDTFGRVEKLDARYISIATRAGRNILIPNEMLITEKVENWSYDNRVVRLTVCVGVSYDSDIHLAKDLMLKAAQNHPRILKDPEPLCLLSKFGDSSVDFEVRFWLSDPMNGISQPKSDILFAIWDAFKKNNIRIPFPQRDLHFKSLDKEIKSRLLK